MQYAIKVLVEVGPVKPDGHTIYKVHDAIREAIELHTMPGWHDLIHGVWDVQAITSEEIIPADVDLVQGGEKG